MLLEKQDTELEFLQNNIIDPDLTTPLIAFASVLVFQILAGKFYCNNQNKSLEQTNDFF